ncbi:hypothetical protein AKK86_05710 [Idiomarina sp. FenBw--71]|nr:MULTISPECIES: hypothetical protein [Idiomarina]MRJ41985.1 hypothetical protein [Idiomarina sp. FeN1]NCU57268.1 hypothetical protein [Idiomarina sp. FenA--70]NCU59976.1 hypothetical protein [Idiomarina sp. FenBw--71]UUN12890.1 hypothetical protein KGF88_09545 [Idiomarina loihiensis]
MFNQLLHFLAIVREHGDTGAGGHVDVIVLNIQGVQQIIHDGGGTNFSFAGVV